MQNFLCGFLVGFGAATAIAIFWFHGQGKQWLDKQRQQVKDKL